MRYVSESKAITAYHFVGNKLRDGRSIPPNGEVLYHDKPKPSICEHGLHASRKIIDALNYAPGETICLVKVWGYVEEQHDKLVGTKRMIVSRFDASEVLREFARKQALSVIHLWDAPDIVRKYLETGDTKLRDAARAAAWAAAWDAAGDAAGAAANKMLTEMVSAALAQ